MLTITRKQGESVVIEVGGERVEVMVVSFRDRCVRITIDAPQNVSIMRKELLDLNTPCKIISLPKDSKK